MKPKIGTIVHFHDGYGNTWPAIVTKVHSDTKVDLGTFTKTYSVTDNMEMYTEEGSKNNKWSWPNREEE